MSRLALDLEPYQLAALREFVGRPVHLVGEKRVRSPYANLIRRGFLVNVGDHGEGLYGLSAAGRAAIGDRVITIDSDREVTVARAESGIVLAVEDPHSIAIVEMGPEFVAQLASALAPGLEGLDVAAVWEIASRPAEGILVSDAPGEGYPDRVLLTVSERDAIVAAAILGSAGVLGHRFPADGSDTLGLTPEQLAMPLLSIHGAALHAMAEGRADEAAHITSVLARRLRLDAADRAEAQS